MSAAGLVIRFFTAGSTKKVLDNTVITCKRLFVDVNDDSKP